MFIEEGKINFSPASSVLQETKAFWKESSFLAHLHVKKRIHLIRPSPFLCILISSNILVQKWFDEV
jgi:hypothetical protein